MQARWFRSDRELLGATSGSNHVTGVIICKIQKRRHRCDERVTLREAVATILEIFVFFNFILIIREFLYLDFIPIETWENFGTFREEFQRLRKFQRSS